MSKVIYTIGHSTHSIDEFVKMLRAYHVEVVVDVRTIPKSRHNPQFNEDELRTNLLKHDIGYIHLEELGGLRHTTKASINTAWRNCCYERLLLCRLKHEESTIWNGKRGALLEMEKASGYL